MIHSLTKVPYDDGFRIIYQYDASGNRTMRKMVKAVHFEQGSQTVEDVDQGSEPAIRPRLGIAPSENKAKTEKGE